MRLPERCLGCNSAGNERSLFQEFPAVSHDFWLFGGSLRDFLMHSNLAGVQPECQYGSCKKVVGVAASGISFFQGEVVSRFFLSSRTPRNRELRETAFFEKEQNK
jgi:hypothetical protein